MSNVDPPMQVNAPPKESILEAIACMRADAFIAEWFGKGWFSNGDPKALLAVSIEDLTAYVQERGFPSTTLVENCWGGHDHFVIHHEHLLWHLGYAERGSASLISSHPSLSDARKALVRQLWSLYLTAAHPSHWKEGPPSGASTA
jgi:hypothetical protein